MNPRQSYGLGQAETLDVVGGLGSGVGIGEGGLIAETREEGVQEKEEGNHKYKYIYKYKYTFVFAGF